MTIKERVEQYARTNLHEYSNIIKNIPFASTTNSVKKKVDEISKILNDASTTENVDCMGELNERLKVCIRDVFKTGSSIHTVELFNHLARVKSADFIGMLIWSKSP